MASCEHESEDCKQKPSTTGTTRISAPTDDNRVPSTEKASTSSSTTDSVAPGESISRNNASINSSFERSMKCCKNYNDNNNTSCATSYTSPGQKCSTRLTTGQLKDSEACLGGGQDPYKNRDSIQDIEGNGRLRQPANLRERSTQPTDHNQSPKDNSDEKNDTDNSSSCYDNNNLNNDDITSTQSSNHRHHKTSSYQQQLHHNRHEHHHSSTSSSSYEHKQNSTQQNQTGHRRHLHQNHHHHSRHKPQRSPVEMSSDSAVTPSATSRSPLHRHPCNDGENSASAHNHFEDSDYSRNNDDETVTTTHSQDRDHWSCGTDPTIIPAFLDPSPNPLLNSHRPSKKTLYSSLIPSRPSLSPPGSPILLDGPPLNKKPRLSIPLPEMTDIDSENSGSSEAHIHCLFPELLVMIFCYLDVRDKGRAAQVCVRWRDAAYTRTVWRGIEAKIHLRRSNPSLFRSLAKRGIRRIQILSLKRSLRDVVAGIPDLESLNLSGCYNITDAGLGQALLHRLLTVHELNLSLCKQITDYSLSRIAIYLKNLRVLHLGGCSVISNAGLFVISYGLVKLKTLDLRSCRDLSDQGIAHLAGLGDEVTNQGNLALEHLCLQDCQKLTDQALRYISLGLKNLTKVNLSFCGGVTDTGLQYLAKMPSLRKINLASCDQVTDAGLAHLARGGSRITSLDVSFCDKIGDWGLSCLAGGLFNLECLSLSACNISDNGISHIVQTMHGLTTLNIGQCHRITDRGLNLIADNLKKLSRMDLYGCTQISAKGLERIMQLPSLSSLNLGLWHKR